jgi:hypothetical protein
VCSELAQVTGVQKMSQFRELAATDAHPLDGGSRRQPGTQRAGLFTSWHELEPAMKNPYRG